MSVLIYESIKLNQHFCTNIKIKSSEVKMIVLKWKWNHYEKLISAQNRIKSSPCGFWNFAFIFQTVLNSIELLQNIAAREFKFLRFDTREHNRGFKYPRKIRNLWKRLNAKPK